MEQIDQSGEMAVLPPCGQETAQQKDQECLDSALISIYQLMRFVFTHFAWHSEDRRISNL